MTPEVAITGLLVILAATCYAFNTHWYFHGWKSQREKFSFWGEESWVRKYKRANKFVDEYHRIIAPDNWYYNLLKIKYKEKFPLSATVLVFLTDGFHLVQWLMIKFLILAMTIHWVDGRGFVWMWGNAICLYALWLFGFNVVYTRLKK